MQRSTESERPILAPNTKDNRASLRFSTYSKASEAPSYKTSASETPTDASDRTDAEIRQYQKGVQRLEDQRAENQRFPMSQEKVDEMEKLALIGKVEKGLQRRFHNQDATMRPLGEQKKAIVGAGTEVKVGEKK